MQHNDGNNASSNNESSEPQEQEQSNSIGTYNSRIDENNISNKEEVPEDTYENNQ